MRLLAGARLAGDREVEAAAGGLQRDAQLPLRARGDDEGGEKGDVAELDGARRPAVVLRQPWRPVRERRERQLQVGGARQQRRAAPQPVLREELWATFHRLRDERGTTLLVSSHVMDEASRCERLILMREGRILADDTPEALLQRTGASDLERAFLRLVRSGTTVRAVS